MTCRWTGPEWTRSGSCQWVHWCDLPFPPCGRTPSVYTRTTHNPFRTQRRSTNSIETAWVESPCASMSHGEESSRQPIVPKSQSWSYHFLMVVGVKNQTPIHTMKFKYARQNRDCRRTFALYLYCKMNPWTQDIVQWYTLVHCRNAHDTHVGDDLCIKGHWAVESHCALFLYAMRIAYIRPACTKNGLQVCTWDVRREEYAWFCERETDWSHLYLDVRFNALIAMGNVALHRKHFGEGNESSTKG